jgi:hypothetical protein
MVAKTLRPHNEHSQYVPYSIKPTVLQFQSSLIEVDVKNRWFVQHRTVPTSVLILDWLTRSWLGRLGLDLVVTRLTRLIIVIFYQKRWLVTKSAKLISTPIDSNLTRPILQTMFSTLIDKVAGKKCTCNYFSCIIYKSG